MLILHKNAENKAEKSGHHKKTTIFSNRSYTVMELITRKE